MLKPDNRRQMPDHARRVASNRFITPCTECRGFEIANRKSEIYSAGQAMVEFMVGLMVVIVLLAGLIQVGQLAQAHTRTMMAARAFAGLLAMSPAPPAPGNAMLISDWNPGSDLHRYTPDDTTLATSNAVTLPGELVEHAHLEWAPDTPTNALATLSDALNPAAGLFLVKGEASEYVPILPLIRRLVYARTTLEVESTAWLVWTKAIY